VDHRVREEVTRSHPLHVTTRIVEGVPSLRGRRERRVVVRAFREGAERRGFRLVHFSVQSNHVHLIVEADDRRALAAGMTGLKTRVAKALNKLWRRAGRVFSDRYHDRILRTPREVRNALVYVLRNHARHGLYFAEVDPCSSGLWFDGWRDPADRSPSPSPSRSSSASASASPFARARSWLLRVGWWKRWGKIAPNELPAHA